MFNDKVFLASGSPRRRELMAAFFKNLSYLETGLEEPRWSVGTDYLHYLTLCVKAKWDSAVEALKGTSGPEGSRAVLVADTIVVLGSKVLGKPESPKDAKHMLRELSGRKHRVFTGVRLGVQASRGSEWKIEDVAPCTEIWFHKLQSVEIDAYVKTREPMDKAGAYGFQDHALKFVSRVEGSYLNVVGLPMKEVTQAAERLGMR